MIAISITKPEQLMRGLYDAAKHLKHDCEAWHSTKEPFSAFIARVKPDMIIMHENACAQQNIEMLQAKGIPYILIGFPRQASAKYKPVLTCVPPNTPDKILHNLETQTYKLSFAANSLITPSNNYPTYYTNILYPSYIEEFLSTSACDLLYRTFDRFRIVGPNQVNGANYLGRVDLQTLYELMSRSGFVIDVNQTVMYDALFCKSRAISNTPNKYYESFNNIDDLIRILSTPAPDSQIEDYYQDILENHTYINRIQDILCLVN